MTDANDLATHIEARFAGPLLIELTNPRTPGASAISSALLEATATDAIARFQRAAGGAYDGSNAAHADVAGDVTVALLHLRAGQLDIGEQRMNTATIALAQLARRSGLVARTGSQVVPPADPQTTHDFTPDDWRGYRSDTLGRTGDIDD